MNILVIGSTPLQVDNWLQDHVAARSSVRFSNPLPVGDSKIFHGDAQDVEGHRFAGIAFQLIIPLNGVKPRTIRIARAYLREPPPP
jgi:hypothetical protein